LSAPPLETVDAKVDDEVAAKAILAKLTPERVLIAHHRGASRYAPENTLAALEKAIALGADFVEFDVRTTRDGHHVLMHDSSLDRTTNGRGAVRDRTEAEVRALDAGIWFGQAFAGTKVPSLGEFLTRAGRRVQLYFDAKDITPEALASALERHGLQDRAVVYQGVEYLEKLLEVAPQIRRMAPLRSLDDLDRVAERVKPYAVDARWSIVTKPMVQRCHALGIKVFSDALGANETPEEYRRAIDAGIDLIQTDHPMRLLRTLESLQDKK
jgi:glycerophosphoryl diester phosphodiesterase